MAEKQAWYENGWVMLFLVVIGVPWGLHFYNNYQEAQLPQVIPQVAAAIEEPLWESPRLCLTVWHQVEGNLRNGSIAVSVNGKVLAADDHSIIQMHSFEIWQPNRDNGVDFEIPLTGFGPEDQLGVAVRIRAGNCHEGKVASTWTADGWK